MAAAARDVLVTVLGSFSFFLPRGLHQRRDRQRGSGLRGRARRDPERAAEDRRASPSGRPPLQRSSPCVPPTASTRRLVDPDYQEGTAPGEYRYTPGTPFAFAPHLGEDLTPFVLKEALAVPPGPAVLADQPQVRGRRQRDSAPRRRRRHHSAATALTTRPRSPCSGSRARRWRGTASPGRSRLPRDSTSGRAHGCSACSNLAMTDGYIGTWDAKYHYRFWRPVTAIRLADIDGNPATTADPTWTPLLENPPIPDYDSGHAVEGGTAAQVLKRFFQTDKMSFSACSFTLPVGQRCSDALPTLRHFTSFSQAADENAVSRIYVGFHFRDAVETGTRHGEKIANRAVDHFLRPSDD